MMGSSRRASAICLAGDSLITAALLAGLLLAGCDAPSSESRSAPSAEKLGRLQIHYEGVLRDDPRDLSARQALGEVYLQQGRLDRAMDCFGVVLAADSAHVEALLGLGEVMRGLGDPERALALARKAVGIRSDAVTLGSLAAAWARVGQLRLARETYVAALQLDGERPGLHYALGGLLEQEGDLAAARQSYREAVNRDPRNEEALFALGRLSCEGLGRCREALTWLRRAVRAAPDSARYRVAVGRALLQLGLDQEALDEFARAADLDPSSADARIGLGVGHARLGSYRQAAAALETAVRLDPVHPDARLQLAAAYHHIGREREAQAQQAAYERLRPHLAQIEQLRALTLPGRRDAAAHLRLATLYAGLGHDAGAAQQLREGLALQPGNARAWHNLGNAYARLHRPAEAISAYIQALELEPEYGLAWYNLGTAYAAQGYLGRARESYERALELKAGEADVLHALGNLDLQQGRFAEAIGRYEQALAADSTLLPARRGLVLAHQAAGDSVAAARALQAYRARVSRAAPAETIEAEPAGPARR